MKKLDTRIVASNTFNILVISILFFVAVYFFIGRDVVYMAKTQEQINQEVLTALQDDKAPRDPGANRFSSAFRKARENNVGLSVTEDAGSQQTLKPDDDKRMLRLEVGGRFVTREVFIDQGRGKAVLTYFLPYPGTERTIKFLPVFLRLVLLFTIFGAAFSILVAKTTALLMQRELKRIIAFASSLVKGSSQVFAGQVKHLEFEKLLTELKALQEIITKKEQLKKRMTSDLAHELRTPLTTLQSHLEALIEGVWEPTTDRFISCHEEILRLIRLVGDLERLSRLEDENLVLNKTGFDLTELVKNLSINFEGELTRQRVSLILNGTVQEVEADRDKMSQVIVNLLSNSLKYTPVNGRVLVDISGDQDYVCLTVNDSGLGIPAKDIAHVFNRLYRSDSSRARDTGGAGIGLTVAKSIIEAHGGSIDLVSQEGLGTEITVIIPRK